MQQSFNDCIHMHLVPYLKSQITPLRTMRWIRSHCPPDIVLEIRALAVWGRARYLSVMEDPVLHTILTSEWERKFCFSENWMPEWGTNPRSPDFSSRPLYNHFISPHPPPPNPPPPAHNCSSWEYTNPKERLAKLSVQKKKITPYDSVLSNRTCAMLDFQIH